MKLPPLLSRRSASAGGVRNTRVPELNLLPPAYLPGPTVTARTLVLIVLLAEDVASKAVTATLSIKSLDDGLKALASTQNLSVHKVSPYLTLLY
mgnify:CR=1 FL=1